jgi:hypothetical protein
MTVTSGSSSESSFSILIHSVIKSVITWNTQDILFPPFSLLCCQLGTHDSGPTIGLLGHFFFPLNRFPRWEVVHVSMLPFYLRPFINIYFRLVTQHSKKSYDEPFWFRGWAPSAPASSTAIWSSSSAIRAIPLVRRQFFSFFFSSRRALSRAISSLVRLFLTGMALPGC